MDQDPSNRKEAGKTGEVTDQSGSRPRDPPDERLNGVESAHSRASLPLSRREALASLLGVSGFSLLSDPVSAVRGTFQSQTGAGRAFNSEFARTVTFPDPKPGAGDSFGGSVSVSGDGQTALVGAPMADPDNCSNAGEAYVFTRTEAGWNTDDPVVLPNPDPNAGDWFGDAVALSSDGRTALIGAYRDDIGADTYVGEAYIFRRTEAGWNADSPVVLPNPEPDRQDYFGRAVAINADGTTALVGSPGETADSDEEGAAYLFTRTETGWNTTTPVTLPNPEPYFRDWFGYGVAVSADGTTALVSARNDQGPPGTVTITPYSVGEAYVFTQTEGGWDTENPVTFLNPDPEVGDLFGYSVALSADAKTALIGERDVAGAANLYSRTGRGWNTDNPVALSNPAPGGPMALSADGTTVLVGMPGQDDGLLDSVGTAYAYRRTDAGWDATNPVQLPNPDPPKTTASARQ